MADKGLSNMPQTADWGLRAYVFGMFNAIAFLPMMLVCFAAGPDWWKCVLLAESAFGIIALLAHE